MWLPNNIWLLLCDPGCWTRCTFLGLNSQSPSYVFTYDGKDFCGRSQRDFDRRILNNGFHSTEASFLCSRDITALLPWGQTTVECHHFQVHLVNWGGGGEDTFFACIRNTIVNQTDLWFHPARQCLTFLPVWIPFCRTAENCNAI